MGRLLAALAGLLGSASLPTILNVIQRALLTIGVTYFAWKLERSGAIDATVGAVGQVAGATGDVAAATGQVAKATGGASQDALLFLGGAAIVIFALRR